MPLTLAAVALVLLAAPFRLVDAAKESEQCCQQLGFPNEKGATDVCSQGLLPSVGCTNNVPFKTARSICRDAGARLCTRKELKNKEGAEAGCDFGKEQVWTSGKCNGDRKVRVAARGKNGKKKRCLPIEEETSTAAVICCADACSVRCASAQNATYRVTVESQWQESPALGNERLTSFAGWAHDGSEEGRYWDDGFVVSNDGLRRLAEVGTTTSLVFELESLEEGGFVLGPEEKSRDVFTPGSETWSTLVDRAHPWASHISRISPSPDWFVGDHTNFLEGGMWVDTVVKELGTWDAGGEDGDDFDATNDNTFPQEPITALEKPLRNGPGTLTMELIACDTSE